MVLVCCQLQNKVESKVWRQYYWTLLPTKEAVGWSENVVKEKSNLQQKDIHLRGGSGDLLKVHLKK